MKHFFKFPVVTVFLIFSGFMASADNKHTVVKGDTLYNISKRNNITVQELCEANHITQNDVLKLGQVLVIPSKGSAVSAGSSTSTPPASTVKKTEPSVPGNQTISAAPDYREFDTYTVQKGDTFWRISKINGISVDDLKKLNNLTDGDTLKIGQKLKIPKSKVTGTEKMPDLKENDPRKYTNKKGDSNLVWPVQNPKVTYITGKVSGVQLSAQKNEAVTAIRAGTVMFCGNYRGYGQVVFVQSKTGQIYAYCGLGSIIVKKGQYVIFGDTLGSAGTDSISGASQITLMVFQKSKPIDPAVAPRG